MIAQALERGPGRNDVDDPVPKTLQRQDKRGSVVKLTRHCAVVNQAVHAVGRRGHPSNEQDQEEEHRALAVGPGGVVRLVLVSTARGLHGSLGVGVYVAREDGDLRRGGGDLGHNVTC